MSALVTDALLFLHVLAAFLMAATAVMLSGVALGTAAPARSVRVANLLWDVGGLGTLVFGIWLALDIEGYGLLDLWIVAALVLWVIGAALGSRARGSADGPADGFARWHWLRVAVLVLLLADMIFKPGA